MKIVLNPETFYGVSPLSFTYTVGPNPTVPFPFCEEPCPRTTINLQIHIPAHSDLGWVVLKTLWKNPHHAKAWFQLPRRQTVTTTLDPPLSHISWRHRGKMFVCLIHRSSLILSNSFVVSCWQSSWPASWHMDCIKMPWLFLKNAFIFLASLLLSVYLKEPKFS